MESSPGVSSVIPRVDNYYYQLLVILVSGLADNEKILSVLGEAESLQ